MPGARRSLSAIVLVVVACLGSSGRAPAATEPTDRPAGAGLRVLFIGNSLTYANDLPAMVEALSDSAGDPRISTRTVALPDFSLDDHWANGAAARAIDERGWDVVVMQQGPSSLPESREQLIASARRFAEVIGRAGAKPALYMVWPSDAWRAAWRRDAAAALYSDDGFHPTPAGTYLGALVIYGRLSHHSIANLPARFALRSGQVVAIAPPLAVLLKAAAAEAIATAE